MTTDIQLRLRLALSTSLLRIAHRSAWPWVLAGCGLFVLASCSNLPNATTFKEANIELPSTSELDRVLSGEHLLSARAAEITLPEEDIFSLNPEIRSFLKTHVPQKGSGKIKLRRLIYALMHQDIVGIRYHPFKTYSAQDTFRFKQGNCLSFTVMVIAMARELGIRAYFNEVEVPPIWDMHDESTYVLYKHINAIIYLKNGERQVVDLNLEEYDLEYAQRKIDDRLAKAQYYNNRGIEFLQDNNIEQAFRYMRKAISLEPRVGYLWGSLGTLYRRSGLLREAEIAYLHALQLTPSEVVSVSNLERLYRQMGQSDRAAAFYDLAIQFRQKNPYYRYNKARDAIKADDMAGALKHIRAAIRGYRKDHRFHHLAAVIYQKQGDSKNMRKSLRRAAKVALTDDDIHRYRNKLDQLLAFN